MLSQYTTYLAHRLCGGSSRKLIAGWWYVHRLQQLWRCLLRPCKLLWSILERRIMSISIIILIWNSRAILAHKSNCSIGQVLNFGNDSGTFSHELCPNGAPSLCGSICIGMECCHAMLFIHWRDHDHEEISQQYGGRIFYGMCRDLQSIILLALSHVHWLRQRSTAGFTVGQRRGFDGRISACTEHFVRKLCRYTGSTSIRNSRQTHYRSGRDRGRRQFLICTTASKCVLKQETSSTKSSTTIIVCWKSRAVICVLPFLFYVNVCTSTCPSSITNGLNLRIHVHHIGSLWKRIVLDVPETG